MDSILSRNDSAEIPAVGTGWKPEAGAWMLLPALESDLLIGTLLRPAATDETVGDTIGLASDLRDGEVELFARSGSLGRARLRVRARTVLAGDSASCRLWPTVDLERASDVADVPLAPWTAAFAAGRVRAIPLDSIEGLRGRDSTRVVAALARLASAIREDSVTTFRGLPFVVLHAWQSREIAPGVLVATLARRVNQEDAPREERLVMIVEQPQLDPESWTIAWHERAAGSEEELVVAEPLLAFRLTSSDTVQLLFGRDYGSAMSAAILTRENTRWRVLWESALAGCDEP